MAEQSSPTITLTTPTPSFTPASTLPSPPVVPPNQSFASLETETRGYTMNDYTSDNNEGGGEGGLDMEVLHDFGEGVGVDMRDFGHGHTKEDSGGMSIFTWKGKDTD